MEGGATWASEKGIPVRNLWFLLVYASKLAELREGTEGGVDDQAELPDLLATLLAVAIERRLRRGLGRGYVTRTSALTRVRGRIDWLATESRQQLLRGQITCRFDDLTLDRPRNRVARTALAALANRTSNAKLAARLRDLDRNLDMWGVRADRPSHASLLADMPSPRETDDRLMVEAALLALDLILPAEAAEGRASTRLARDEQLLRKIFEAGVAGFLRHRRHGREGWKVRTQRALAWQTSDPTPGLPQILPGMNADIILEREEQRIVIETKFTAMLTRDRFDREVLKNAHIYQLYAYVRSQANLGPAAAGAEGLLLYPALDEEREEAVTIDGHRIRFASINLRRVNVDLGARIEAIVGDGSSREAA